LAVAQQLIDTDTHLLELVEVRRTRGSGGRSRGCPSGSTSQAGQVDGATSLRVALEAQLNRLDVLMGAQPGTYPKSFPSQARFPGIPAIGGANQPSRCPAPAGPTSSQPSAGWPRRTSELALQSPTTIRRFRFPARSVSTASTGGTLFNGKAFQPIGTGALRWRLFDFGKVAAEVAQSRGYMPKCLPSIGRQP